MLEQIGKELKVATWGDFVTMIIMVTVTFHLFGVVAGSANGAVASINTPAVSSGGNHPGQQQYVAAGLSFQRCPDDHPVRGLIIIVLLNRYGDHGADEEQEAARQTQ